VRAHRLPVGPDVIRSRPGRMLPGALRSPTAQDALHPVPHPWSWRPVGMQSASVAKQTGPRAYKPRFTASKSRFIAKELRFIASKSRFVANHQRIIGSKSRFVANKPRFVAFDSWA
jgi:hypothetical protein